MELDRDLPTITILGRSLSSKPWRGCVTALLLVRTSTTSQELPHTFTMDSQVHIHSPMDVANAFQGHRSLRLAPNGNTYTGCFLSVSDVRESCRHEYWTSVILQISAFKTPGHIHYRCDGIQIQFCCPTRAERESLVRGATALTQNLLNTVYPQLSCDLSQIPRYACNPRC